MLKNRYQEIIVGLNFMSLIRGIISVRKNRTTLLIDDERFRGESTTLNYLSELEILALIRVGKKYNIQELLDIKQFLTASSIEYITPQIRLKLGHSPFENLREVLRKYPELLDASDLDLVFNEGPESFNRYFVQELRRYESSVYDNLLKPNSSHFELQGPAWFKAIYQRFSLLLNKEYSASKTLKYSGLLHLMGIFNEEKMKINLSPEEVPYYFFRLFSPVYRLKNFFLTTQLKRRLLLEGGDFKESSVQYWQFHEEKFENLLLSSFEGVISSARVLFFSHLPEDVPFQVKSRFPVYRKHRLEPLKRQNFSSPPSRLTVLSNPDLLGSDGPYRVIEGEGESIFYHWPYPEQPGSKPEFFEKQMIENFENDLSSVPFEKLPTAPQAYLSVTLDMRSARKSGKAPSSVLTRLPVEVAIEDKNIQGFEYWGPFRFKGLGVLALCYGVEGI